MFDVTSKMLLLFRAVPRAHREKVKRDSFSPRNEALGRLYFLLSMSSFCLQSRTKIGETNSVSNLRLKERKREKMAEPTISILYATLAALPSEFLATSNKIDFERVLRFRRRYLLHMERDLQIGAQQSPVAAVASSFCGLFPFLFERITIFSSFHDHEKRRTIAPRYATFSLRLTNRQPGSKYSR